MPPFVLTPNALADDELDRLEGALLASKLIGDSPLMGTFEASRGFAVVFTREGVGEVRARFPSLSPYLDLVMDDALRRSLVTWKERLLGRSLPPVPNAFYLNLLLLGRGARVGRHVDTTLRDESGIDEAVPQYVSVLYLRVPDQGGALRLRQGLRHVADIVPVRNALVCFEGELEHEVLPFESDDENELRASVVCEQYALPPEGLARMPRCRVHSLEGFPAYLRPSP